VIISTARRIGCSIFFLVAGAVAWHFRDLWLPKVLRFVERTVGW
jgi:hypothetical protein